MPQQRQPSFALILFNINTYRSGGVISVISGRSAAEKILRDFESGQNDRDRHAGWRYFIEESDLVPGISAEKATKLRQAQLDRREAQATSSSRV